ncbi:MAG: bi-domain-containing oxidoreductase [bacterium]|nr:bi-domain-containing oxidoreductase [bacterium]
MNQLTQKLKNGSMQILDAPLPQLSSGTILVKNHYSLVSAGTEGSTVKAARSSLVEKARARPQQVKQVIDTLRTQGVTQTYRAVMKKLDAYSPLGYSCCGEVIAVAPDVTGFCVGDLVACGGLSASHAEVVCVPVNLCIKLHPDADMRQAAFNTLGAIAMQGVRQADLRLGETCLVIGLGLLGQLTALLLKASGIRTIGVDIDPAMVDLAVHHAVDLGLVRNAPDIRQTIHDFTNGLGCDAVIVAAATQSLDPINFAGACCRKRGTIVLLGDVATGFDREPHFYKKELQVRMSCSYGPGRYDPEYEEKGRDYPPAYVRWTENRNMQAFQDLIHARRIDVGYLATHTFDLNDSQAAYDLVMSKSEPFIGILLKYDSSKKHVRARLPLKPQGKTEGTDAVSIAFIGAGSYAQSHLLPNIPLGMGVRPAGILTATAAGSRSTADRFGFEFCAGSEDDILSDPSINTVFIATRHDSHGGYVLRNLQAGKHVFVEKPLCRAPEELQDIYTCYADLAQVGNPPQLLVGYNRRFAPLAIAMKEKMGQGPLAVNCLINAGFIPADSWMQDMDLGGGRIVGEVCHFVDLCNFLTGSLPVSVYAISLPTPEHLHDTVSINLSYENGSIATINYFANGDKSLPKERIQVFGGGSAAVLNDFRGLSVYAAGKRTDKKLLSQNKGQKTAVHSFIESVRNGGAAPITFDDLYSTSLTTFAVLESLRSCAPVSLRG